MVTNILDGIKALHVRMDIKHNKTFSFDILNLFYIFNFSFFIAQSAIWTYSRTFPVLTAFFFINIT